MKTFLFQLPVKKRAVIKNVNTDKATKERLHSLGLIEDAEISYIRSAPLGCPRIYKCLNTFVAIRNDIAKKIEVELIKCSD